MVDKEIKFHFIKAPDYKEISVDGAFGGFNVVGKIVAAIYTDRPAIPTCVVHEIDGSKLGKELVEKREVKEGAVRTVHAVLYFDLHSAEGFREWLDQKISELKAIKELAK